MPLEQAEKRNREWTRIDANTVMEIDAGPLGVHNLLNSFASIRGSNLLMSIRGLISHPAERCVRSPLIRDRPQVDRTCRAAKLKRSNTAVRETIIRASRLRLLAL